MDLKRSWMFVPGHRQKMIDKALGLGTDAIMLDIEDGVAPNEKDAARKNIAESLGRLCNQIRVLNGGGINGNFLGTAS